MKMMGDISEFSRGRGPDRFPRRRRLRRAGMLAGGAGLTLIGAYAAKKGLGRSMKVLDGAIEQRARSMSRAASRGATAGAVEGAAEGVGTGAFDTVKKIGKSASSRANQIAKTPENTAKAFREGMRSSPKKDSRLIQAARNLGRARARSESAVRRTRKRYLGFSMIGDYVDFYRH